MTETNKTIEPTFSEQDRYGTLIPVILNLIFMAAIQFYVGWVAERDRRYLLGGEEDAKMDDVPPVDRNDNV